MPLVILMCSGTKTLVINKTSNISNKIYCYQYFLRYTEFFILILYPSFASDDGVGTAVRVQWRVQKVHKVLPKPNPAPDSFPIRFKIAVFKSGTEMLIPSNVIVS